MNLDQRIAQFENMVRSDPDNDMAHFSLGGAYRQAGRHADAAASFMACIATNPSMSKAYQLAGEAFRDAGRDDDAARVLSDGYRVAAARGDSLPRAAMSDLLRAMGRPVPEVSAPARSASAAGDFVCSRSGRPGTKMARPPFKGPVGRWIADHISKETFDDWIRQGTKVINELRLDLSREQDEAVYDQHMREYLGIDEALLRTLTQDSPA